MEGDSNSAASAKAFEIKYCDFCHRAIATGYNDSQYSVTVCRDCDGPLAFLYGQYINKEPEKLKKYHCANCSKINYFKHIAHPPVMRSDNTFTVMCLGCKQLSYISGTNKGIAAYE